MTYIPNRIPFRKRVLNIFLSLILIIYGSHGIYTNDLYIIGKRGGLHLHDGPAFMMFAAFLCGSLVMLSVVIDHYDKRNNEQKYKSFASFFEITGWWLFVISLIWFLTRSV